MECMYCGAKCQKAGRQKNGRQRHYCKSCNRYQQENYKNLACMHGTSRSVKQLLCEGAGIRGMARILGTAPATILSHIRKIAAGIPKPPILIGMASVEMDKLRTYVGLKHRLFWVAYAFCPITKRVVDFTVGRRTKPTLKIVTGNLLASGTGMIHTDKLNIYRAIIPKEKHNHESRCINHIERHNLNIRTHLKRLSRRTICFSRNKAMLEACLKIYFWHP